MMTSFKALATLLTILPLTRAIYVLKDDYSGDSFFKNFDFFTDADPTNGHVQFQSMKQANASGIAGFMTGGNATKAVYMGVDTTSQAPNGRGSVRVQSQKSYQHALVIADIVHMPGGVCGTWPAFWMVGDNWPVNGEIDIIEGVNDQNSNQMTLHTDTGVVISKQTSQQVAGGLSKASTKAFTGSVLTANCDVNAPGQSKNAGCSIADDSGLTFGADFNANGGGVVATEWTSEAIKIWMFPRGSFPSDISSSQPNPSAHWGSPTSLFTGNFSMDDHFKNLAIVFDTTFCGDWAGKTWNSPGSKCAALAPTCEQYVTENPKAFDEAYWAINTLQVFQDDGNDKQNEDVTTEQRQQFASTFGTEVEAKGNFIKSILDPEPAPVLGDGSAGTHIRKRQDVKARRWTKSQSRNQDQDNQGWPSEWEKKRNRSGGAVLPT